MTIKAKEANANARAFVRAGEAEWFRKCLKFVRTCWELDPHFATAREAWEGSKDRHKFTNEDAIPYGAPVFTTRPHAAPDDAGHVIIAGGYNRKGQRIYRSVDIVTVGLASCVTLDVFTTKWGHKVLGWTGDLNGVDLNLPKPPSERK